MAEATPADWRDTCEHCGRAFDASEPRWLEQRRYFVHTECARWERWETPPYVWKLKELRKQYRVASVRGAQLHRACRTRDSRDGTGLARGCGEPRASRARGRPSRGLSKSGSGVDFVPTLLDAPSVPGRRHCARLFRYVLEGLLGSSGFSVAYEDSSPASVRELPSTAHQQRRTP